jgi:two-component system, cell cycle sensor histidine kinase and response regulator CckA
MCPTKALGVTPSEPRIFPPSRNGQGQNIEVPACEKTGDVLRKLWQALDQCADPIVITNRLGIIEYVNPGFEILTGYSKAEAMGSSPRILRSDKEGPEVYEEMWETVFSGNTFRGKVVSQKRNGEAFSVEKTITPLRDGAGQITHFISTDRDITERCKLELQLEQAHKMDAIGRLAGGVAHDFNNLLMVISSYAELMLDSLSAKHPLLHNVQEIMAASRRAADLTRQLLVFSRKQVQTLQLLDLNSVIHEISEMLLRMIGEDIEFVFVPGVHLGIVKADPIQIEQVLMNLAGNARDAMPQGGKLTIETADIRLDEIYVQKHAIVPAGDYTLLTVTDSGGGIAPQHLPHIFEPFYTTKKENEGTGLGLATVYGVVKQSGGFVWVYSEPGMGTTFKIYLPSVYIENCGLGRTAPIETFIPPGCETILLVEDEPAVRQSEREFLRLNGYKVLEAADGEDALHLATEFRGLIHLMITDVVMPRMGGAKLGEQLQALRPDMKVLFVSGYAEATVLRQGSIDLPTSFLQKPFSLKTLAHKIREMLERNLSSRAASTSSD